MIYLILSPLLVFALALGLGVFLFPMLTNIDKQILLANAGDMSDVHRGRPILGGIGISIILLTMFSINPFIQDFTFNNPTICLLAAWACFTGLVNDKKNTPALFRLFSELSCAFLVAVSGFRLFSLPGIGRLSVTTQYFCTTLIIFYIINFYKLSIRKGNSNTIVPAINLAVLSGLSFLLRQPEWGALLAAAAGATVAFIQFNRFSGNIKLGNSGSMLTSFLVSVASIHLYNIYNAQSTEINNAISSNYLIAPLLTICFSIPLIYAVKVFITEIKRQSLKA